MALFLGERPYCQARLAGCTGWAVDGHELLRRSQGGDPLDPAGMLALCRACHRWVTEHPAAAVDAGLAVWRWRANPPMASRIEVPSAMTGVAALSRTRTG